MVARISGIDKGCNSARLGDFMHGTCIGFRLGGLTHLAMHLVTLSPPFSPRTFNPISYTIQPHFSHMHVHNLAVHLLTFPALFCSSTCASIKLIHSATCTPQSKSMPCTFIPCSRFVQPIPGCPFQLCSKHTCMFN